MDDAGVGSFASPRQIPLQTTLDSQMFPGSHAWTMLGWDPSRVRDRFLCKQHWTARCSLGAMHGRCWGGILRESETDSFANNIGQPDVPWEPSMDDAGVGSFASPRQIPLQTTLDSQMFPGSQAW